MNIEQIGAQLISAGTIPPQREGRMVISLSGVISLGARALREMAEPMDLVSEVDREELAARMDNSQPGIHAFSLEELGRHLEMLKVALANGDAKTVRQFFDLYVD